MTYYKSYRNIDRKLRWVVVDKDGMITNRNPSHDELKGLEIKERRVNRKKITTEEEYRKKFYTDEDLLNELRRFLKEEGYIPRRIDFVNNPGYPSSWTYQNHFGSWGNALKLLELDVESISKKGILENNSQKARFAEIIVLNHFKTCPIDMAGKNKNSPCDGICPNGKIYDVKGSGFDGVYWTFKTSNKYKKNIDIYYFLAFNSDWTKLNYVWRVPGNMVDRDMFYVGLNSNYKFNIENMEKYDITENFKNERLLEQFEKEGKYKIEKDGKHDDIIFEHE